MNRLTTCSLFVSVVLVSQGTRADETGETLKLVAPLPHSVTQRAGLVLSKATSHEPGGPRRGVGQVKVQFELPASLPAVGDIAAEFRVVALEGAWGAGSDWGKLPGEAQAGHWRGTAAVAAGGWYRLEVRLRAGEKTLASEAVEPIGVGEVFLVAGQSYATNCNDEVFQVAEPAGRVVAYDFKTGGWRVAHDPQPAGDASDRGSIWPPVGDMLAGVLEVPIGFVNVAVGATASSQWLPGTPLCDRLIAAGKTQGAFRAVLWQQGESDVIAKTSTEQYVQNLLAIRASTSEAWKNDDVPWLLARSTLHPTVYVEPTGESRIRAGIDELCRKKGFRLGPDTDLLAGENRGPLGTMRHFSAAGQKRAALLWFTSIMQLLSAGE